MKTKSFRYPTGSRISVDLVFCYIIRNMSDRSMPERLQLYPIDCKLSDNHDGFVSLESCNEAR
jgi:hypothetical protein